ncbi:ISAon1 family transposase [Acidiluteibacter ferrifornacis]|uniref:ISAon1 family transposase n=1 Tax=Acidiluteibacter ferrifornacis TaxID=2692424 RepID=UPI00293BD754|nr:transposase [Acidiluteibacter ferrifornacis]
MYGVNGKKLQRQYRDYLSDFKKWDQLTHARDWLIFPQNIGKRLSIDEVALSQGELYTIITNKKAKGRAGSIVAIVKGTTSSEVIQRVNKIATSKRRKVEEITLDMAGSMKQIVKVCFPLAKQVTDRFHVQKLASEAVQEVRIKYRWKSIDKENRAIAEAKTLGKTYKEEMLSNSDTVRQLLARSRYLLFKSPDKWTVKQKERSKILFDLYPKIKTAYQLSNQLRIIYNSSIEKGVAMTKLAQWYNEVENSNFKSFKSIMNTISLNYKTILNYFDDRSTNAAAESFNAKIKAFRSRFRGVKNVEFFLFRLTNIYA